MDFDIMNLEPNQGIGIAVFRSIRLIAPPDVVVIRRT